MAIVLSGSTNDILYLKVSRELERLMLTGTDLNLEREELRESIVW